MKYNLLAPVQQRRSRLALTLTASLVFHGSLVGVAALWPHRSVPLPPGPVIFVDLPNPPVDPETRPFNTPDSSTPEPTVEPVPPPPLATPTLADDTPPPDPTDSFAPSLNTPPPRPVVSMSHSARSSAHSIPNQTNARSLVGPGGGQPGIFSPGRPGPTMRWQTASKPAYPAALRTARVQGSGTVRITTNASGRVVSATMATSTGSTALDENTCQHARTFWSGPANASITVPVTYQLH